MKRIKSKDLLTHLLLLAGTLALFWMIYVKPPVSGEESKTIKRSEHVLFLQNDSLLRYWVDSIGISRQEWLGQIALAEKGMANYGWIDTDEQDEPAAFRNSILRHRESVALSPFVVYEDLLDPASFLDSMNAFYRGFGINAMNFALQQDYVKWNIDFTRSCGGGILYLVSLDELMNSGMKYQDTNYVNFARDWIRSFQHHAATISKNKLLAGAFMDIDTTLFAEGEEKSIFENIVLGAVLRKMVCPDWQVLFLRYSKDCFKPAYHNKSLRLIDSVRSYLAFDGLIVVDAPEKFGFELMEHGADVCRMKKDLSLIKNDPAKKELAIQKIKRVFLAKQFCMGAEFKADSLPSMPSIDRRDNIYWRLKRNQYALLKDENNLVPLRNIEKGKTLILYAGMQTGSVFRKAVEQYVESEISYISSRSSRDVLNKIPYWRKYERIFLCMDAEDSADMPEIFPELLDSLRTHPALICFYYGNAELLPLYDSTSCFLYSWSMNAYSVTSMVQSVFGGHEILQSLPHTFSSDYEYGKGILIDRTERLGVAYPVEAGISSRINSIVDSIAKLAIRRGAFPGCQVFAARKGKIFLNKSYGHQTYNRLEKVEGSHLYDIASVTKVAATTLAVMKLIDRDSVDVDSTLDVYFQKLDYNRIDKKVRNSGLKNLKVGDLLTHTTGLPAALPLAPLILLKPGKRAFPADTLINPADTMYEFAYSFEKKELYETPLAEGIYLRNFMLDSIWQLAKTVQPKAEKDYRYSDFNFYLLGKLVKERSGVGLDTFVRMNIYQPLALERICFNPFGNGYKKNELVPTERERGFRKQLVHGYVHDPTAALNGGVCGNAGLFCNAESLGILMQMLLNKGRYGGKQIISEKTVKLFTQHAVPYFRSLGFSMQTSSGNVMIAPSAGINTYGHTGFTGTCVWIDPDEEIVFVFLSNRVHPRSSNRKINQFRVRQMIQQSIYDCIMPEFRDNIISGADQSDDQISV